ncbi:MAG: hypothetical protein FJ395_06070 [Verrucomicrobia bacterium]|nr:hypothetical protein [Verrucomicrobiota bacterium]
MAESLYTGICIVKMPSGEAVQVQMKTPTGHKNQISVSDYKRRGIKPPIEELPDCNAVCEPCNRSKQDPEKNKISIPSKQSLETATNGSETKTYK